MSSLGTGTVFTLDDGTTITSRELADKIGITQSSARSRLKRSTDPKVIFRPSGTTFYQRPYIKYTLTNGRVMTALDIANEANLEVTNVSRRLSKGVREYDRLIKPVDKDHGKLVKHGKASNSREVKDAIAKRNYNDPLSRLLLRTI